MTIVKILLVLLLIVHMIRKFTPLKGVQQIAMKELPKKIDTKNFQIIDVRTPGEYKINHLEGAINIPLRKLNKQTDKLAKD